jgi:hypothetical protein
MEEQMFKKSGKREHLDRLSVILEELKNVRRFDLYEMDKI